MSHITLPPSRVRIAYMSSGRIFLSLAAAAFAVVSLAVAACGPSTPDSPTVPPAPTAPIATSAPDAVAASGDAPALSAPAVPSVPHRTYNALGVADAPIVMFDYSDFT